MFPFHVPKDPCLHKRGDGGNVLIVYTQIKVGSVAANIFYCTEEIQSTQLIMALDAEKDQI